MSTQVAYIPLEGGLDLSQSALTTSPGKISECSNFEQVFGRQGYRRMDGYERFDGHPEPSKSTYYIQRFDAGSSIINVGDLVTGASMVGLVIGVYLESGAWGSDAVGSLILDHVIGSFADNETISVSTAKATANGVTELGSISEADHITYLRLAIDARRAAISAVPGEGAVLGVALYLNNVFAVRNIVGGASATMWISTSSGWVAVRTGLYPGGAYKFVVANFSGVTANTTLYGVNGKGRLFSVRNTTFTYAAPIYGSEATSVTSNTIGTGAKTFTITQPTRSWVAGDSLLIYSTANAANRMQGTVTSYSASTLVVNVTSTNGSGTLTDWEIGLASFKDKPYDLIDHKEHLFLAYPYGQLQTSNLGDPMTYTTTASLFGIGDEITGMAELKGGSIGIFGRTTISLISGSSSLDWASTVQVNSASSGAREGSLQGNAGNAIFVDEKGISSLQATLNYGSFETALFSRNVKTYLDTMVTSIVGSRMQRSKYQYRLYFSNGDVLNAAIMSPDPVVSPDAVSFTRQKLLHIPTCFCEGEMSDAEFAYFFGTADGYVMREDVGTSMDGAQIESAMRLNFNNFKSPSNKKRFRKLVLELDAPSGTLINFRQHFDYADSNYAASGTRSATSTGNSGGAWGSSEWDAFYWSSPLVSQAEANIDGVGRNMALLLWHTSDIDQPFTLQGVLTHYSILGLQR